MGTTGVVSPNTFKRLHDFSHGVLDHVKSYYNSSLWQTESKGPSVLSTPLVAEKPAQMNGIHELPSQLKEAETLRPSSETETEMPEMSEVSSAPFLKKQSKQLARSSLVQPPLSFSEYPHKPKTPRVLRAFCTQKSHLCYRGPNLNNPPASHTGPEREFHQSGLSSLAKARLERILFPNTSSTYLLLNI